VKSATETFCWELQADRLLALVAQAVANGHQARVILQ
jgi:hypothetical protein